MNIETWTAVVSGKTIQVRRCPVTMQDCAACFADLDPQPCVLAVRARERKNSPPPPPEPMVA